MGASEDALNSFVHLTRIRELHPHFVIVHGFYVLVSFLSNIISFVLYHSPIGFGNSLI
jgi:hypothetical protein